MKEIRLIIGPILQVFAKKAINAGKGTTMLRVGALLVIANSRHQ